MTKALAPVVESPLSVAEQSQLSQLEKIIERGLDTFVEVGLALSEVRNSRLYRAEYQTFEHYCMSRWSMTRPRAYQLIAAAEVVANLSTTVDTAPSSERQSRPLSRLEPEQQREAWSAALEISPSPTAAIVESAVREIEGRSSMAVHYSSDSPEWYTPPQIIEAVLVALGEIDLDPCSNAAPHNVPAHKHFTAADDGLKRPWAGTVYMNPPYGDEIGKWTGKLRTEYEGARVTAAVALVPARTDTIWFRALREYPRCFVSGRLKFSGAAASAPFPNALFYFGSNPDRFANAFAEVGDTYALYD